MTDDQKKAAFIIGGIGVLALVIYMTRQQQLPITAVDVPQSPTVATLGGVPSQYIYNIPPVTSTGVDLFPVVAPPATNILGSVYGAPSFGGTTYGNNSYSVTGGNNSVGLGGSSLISNATYGSPGNNGGCCCDITTVSGQTNTGNAPTSLSQLLDWYSGSYPGIVSSLAANATGFAPSNPTIMELTSPLAPPSNISF